MLHISKLRYYVIESFLQILSALDAYLLVELQHINWQFAIKNFENVYC